MDSGSRILDFEFQILDSEVWTLGFWILNFRFRILGFWKRDSESKFSIEKAEKIQKQNCRVFRSQKSLISIKTVGETPRKPIFEFKIGKKFRKNRKITIFIA